MARILSLVEPLPGQPLDERKQLSRLAPDVRLQQICELDHGRSRLSQTVRLRSERVQTPVVEECLHDDWSCLVTVGHQREQLLLLLAKMRHGHARVVVMIVRGRNESGIPLHSVEHRVESTWSRNACAAAAGRSPARQTSETGSACRGLSGRIARWSS